MFKAYQILIISQKNGYHKYMSQVTHAIYKIYKIMNYPWSNKIPFIAIFFGCNISNTTLHGHHLHPVYLQPTKQWLHDRSVSHVRIGESVSSAPQQYNNHWVFAYNRHFILSFVYNNSYNFGYKNPSLEIIL
jgi:hypothetical protein